MYTQEIIYLYQEEGYSLTKLKEKFNYSTDKIKKILNDNNIHIRTRGEQTRITNQLRGQKVNHKFFDLIDTNEKAWLLGFLAADGSVSSDRNRIKIGLSSVDREILEKIQKLIDSERKIMDYETNQGFFVSELCWSSARHKEVLAKYDIVPNKTYKQMRLPNFNNNLDKQISFILGYFDGDGCFKDDDNYCRLEICSYRPELLEDFARVIGDFTGNKKTVYKDKSRINYYTITYSTEDVIKFLDYAYDKNSIFLQRKYEKYQNWLIKNKRI